MYNCITNKLWVLHQLLPIFITIVLQCFTVCHCFTSQFDQVLSSLLMGCSIVIVLPSHPFGAARPWAHFIEVQKLVRSPSHRCPQPRAKWNKWMITRCRWAVGNQWIGSRDWVRGQNGGKMLNKCRKLWAHPRLKKEIKNDKECSFMWLYGCNNVTAIVSCKLPLGRIHGLMEHCEFLNCGPIMFTDSGMSW